MAEQELFKYSDKVVFIQNADGSYYEDTPENFVKDGGVLPKQYVDYNKTVGVGVHINKDYGSVPLFKFPDDVCEINIANIKEFIKNKEKRLYVSPPEPTEEELAQAKLAKAKEERADAVSKLTVTVDGMVFDADETSQNRMSRVVAGAQALGIDQSTTQVWVLADNTVATPTVAQLAQALKLAGEAQTALWTVPYQTETTESTAN